MFEKIMPKEAKLVVDRLQKSCGNNWKQFIKEIEQFNHKLIIKIVNGIVDQKHEYTPKELGSGCYKLEKHVRGKEFGWAWNEIRDAIDRGGHEAQMATVQAIKNGVTPITFSDTVNRKERQKFIDDKAIYEDSLNFYKTFSFGLKKPEMTKAVHQIPLIPGMPSAPGEGIEVGYADTSSGAKGGAKGHLEKFIMGTGTANGKFSMADLAEFEDYMTLQDKPGSSPGWVIVLRHLRPWLTPGDGTECEIKWNPKITYQCSSSSDKSTSGTVGSDIILVHEMVHAYHFLKGMGFGDPSLEEAQTIGFFPFDNDIYTENNYRPNAINPLIGKDRKIYDFETQ